MKRIIFFLTSIVFAIQSWGQCDPPANLIIDTVTSTYVRISWTAGSGTDWEGVLNDTINGSIQVITPPQSGNPYKQFGSLSAATNYIAYIRTKCVDTTDNSITYSSWQEMPFQTTCPKPQGIVVSIMFPKMDTWVGWQAPGSTAAHITSDTNDISKYDTIHNTNSSFNVTFSEEQGQVAPSSCYEFWLRMLCNDSVYSEWDHFSFGTPVTNIQASDITPTSVTLTWTAGNGTYKVNTPWGEVTVDTASYTITGLTPCTQYVFGVSANCYGNNPPPFVNYTVTTGGSTALVMTEAATNITLNSATLNSTIQQGCYAIVEQGYKYRKGYGAWITNIDGILTGLDTGATYQFYAYMITTHDTINGQERTFTTQSIPPVILTSAAIVNENLCDEVMLNGAIINTGTPAANEYGFVYGTSTPVKLGIGSTLSVSTNPNGLSLTANVTGLNDTTLYYYNIYAKANGITYYGTENTFSTCFTNSLTDIENNFQVNIFPNPAKNTVKFDFDGLNQDVFVSILNINGQKIEEFGFKANQKSYTMDISKYSSGIYYVRILNDRVNKVNKLIIQK
ncbi:MAG: T9SS type A sorting domain-containing protein [Bacteroidales bacterium]|jgi:hypothetical protein|nr:T9SS type A sorting domain-containing protein [Bacteroidales bacterium]